MMVNMACALLLTLKVAVKETQSAIGNLKSSAVEKVMQDLLHVSNAHLCLPLADCFRFLLSFQTLIYATLLEKL